MVSGPPAPSSALGNAAAAAREAAFHKDVKDREGIAGRIVVEWAKTDLAQATAWARELPAEIGAQALRHVSSSLAEKDFAAALSLAADAAPEQAGALYAGLAWKIPPDQAPVVASRLEHLPESPERAAAARKTADIWTMADPDATSDWLTRLPEGATRDAAIAGFTEHVVRGDPEAAAEWAAVIGSDDLRRDGLRDSLRFWTRMDPNAARDWIQQSPRLTEEDRERLLPITLGE